MIIDGFRVQLKPLREKERKDAIAAGLIPDPLKPRRLDEALTFLGTCEDMCPAFEREEREFQKNVDKWEMVRFASTLDNRKADPCPYRTPEVTV